MSISPINIPETVPATKGLIVPKVVQSVNQLSRQFALQNVRIIQPTKPQFDSSEVDNIQDPDAGLGYKSALGTTVLVDLTFHGQTYQNELNQSFTFPDIKLVAILISINQTKNIVETAIQGRKGTVKEYIGMGDYALTMNVIIAGDNGIYPKGDVQEMITMLNCPNEIAVTSWYLAQFNIFSIIIKSYDCNQGEGMYSRQPISVNAVSDEEVNLRFRP